MCDVAETIRNSLHLYFRRSKAAHFFPFPLSIFISGWAGASVCPSHRHPHTPAVSGVPRQLLTYNRVNNFSARVTIADSGGRAAEGTNGCRQP